MNKSFLLAGALLLGTAALTAQDLPQPSPKAVVEQRIGLTDTKLTYWRPSAKGRDIYTEVVPLGSHWRMGANGSTLLQLSTEATAGKFSLAAGTYSLSLIPEDAEWTLVVNTDIAGWGIYEYDKAKDVARISAPMEEGDYVETLTIFWDGLTADGGDLVVAWGKLRARYHFEFPTAQLAKANLEKAVSDPNAAWTVWRNAARYASDQNMPEAEKWAAKACELKADNWYVHYLYAQILQKNGKTKDARKAAQASMTAGQNEAKKSGKAFGNEEDVQKLMDSLK
jgi:tetratricopeptide (TPR) repeat protein